MSKVPETQEYQYGFHDDIESVYTTGKGISEAIIRDISARKEEPEWMLDFRLKSFKRYQSQKLPTWGADLSGIDFDNITYYKKSSNKPERDWEDVPEKIKETFERLGIPEAERKYLAGAGAQFESEVVYHNMKEEFEKMGIVFIDTDTALKEYADIFKEHFATLYHQQTTN